MIPTDYDQGVLDQAGADIPALANMERWGVQQYHRAEGLRRELNDSWHSRNRLMLACLIEFFVICALLAAVLAGGMR